MNRKLRYTINAVVSIALIATIIYMAGAGRVAEQLSRAIIPIFLLAVVIENFGVAVSAKKWQMLLKMKDMDVSFLTAWKYYYIGTFFNAFLPTSVGGDAVKAYSISKKLERREEGFSSVMMDRLTGLVAVLGIGSVSLVFGWNAIPGTALILCLPIFTLPIVLLAVIFKTEMVENVIRKPFFNRFGRVRDFVERVYDSFKEYGSLKRRMVPVVMLSLFYHLLLITNNYVLSISLGLEIPIHYFFIFIPVAEILVFLPVTVQGFGVREGTYVALFSSVGVGGAEAFALGFSDQIVKLMGNIIGGVVYLFHSIRD